MKGNGNAKKLNNAASLKKSAVSLLLVTISLVALLCITEAWLTRRSLGNVVEGSGFQLRNSGVVIAQDFSIKTYYLGADYKWKLITTDYERNAETWGSIWDPNSGILVPGKRTEFKTVITNLTSLKMEASAFLTGVSMDSGLAGTVKIGAYAPDVFLYESGSTTYFSGGEGDPYVASGTLCIAEKCEIAAYGEVTVNWYVSLGADVDGGDFEALAQADGTYIRNGSNYYSVNKVDAAGNVTEAFECNSRGELIVQNGSLIPYSGSYSELTSKYLTFGNAADTVRISGLYAVAG